MQPTLETLWWIAVLWTALGVLMIIASPLYLAPPAAATLYRHIIAEALGVGR